MIPDSAFRLLCALATFNLLLASPYSRAMREATLTINSLPTGYAVRYPSSEDQKKATLEDTFVVHKDTFVVDNGVLKDTTLTHYLLRKIIDTNRLASSLPIDDNHLTLGRSPLLKTHAMATALHRGDNRLAQNTETPISLPNLFPDNKAPTLHFSDILQELTSVFQGDIQVDDLPTQTDQLSTSYGQKVPLIIIRQKLYPETPNDSDTLNKTSALAIVEYMYKRNADDTVSPYRINIYNPKQQGTLRTRLNYLTGGLHALTMQNPYTSHLQKEDDLTAGSTWLPDTGNSPLAKAIKAGAIVAVGSYLSSTLYNTASYLADYAPSNWISMTPCCGAEFISPEPGNCMAIQSKFPSVSIDWCAVSQFLSKVPDAIANGVLYTAKNVPGLYVTIGSGTLATTTWLYFNKAKRYTSKRDFQNALITFVLATEKELPLSIAPFRAAISDSSYTIAVNAEARTRRTSHHTSGSITNIMVDHKNTTTMYFPASSSGLRQRKL